MFLRRLRLALASCLAVACARPDGRLRLREARRQGKNTNTTRDPGFAACFLIMDDNNRLVEWLLSA